MLIGINPLTIHAKLQLNLKKDEVIIDFSYCISDNYQNHCVWMLDEKLQVWKCTNELNPNSCQWTLVKVTMFDLLYFKKFLQPAMTYQDFYLISMLNKLQCYKNLKLEESSYEFLSAFNGTSTKAVILK